MQRKEPPKFRNDGLIEQIDKLVMNNLKLQDAAIIPASAVAPIYNSRTMLEQIKAYLESGLPEFSSSMLNELNVGLLAAKGLDYFSDEPIFEYATDLHTFWQALLHSINSAGSAGGIHQSAWQTAYDFYTKIAHYDDTRTRSHIGGIDLNKPVTSVLLNGKTVSQWSVPDPQNSYQGDYYGELGSYPDCLGIFQRQGDDYKTAKRREEIKYQVNRSPPDIKTLQSTANSVIDTWSIKNVRVWAPGGCIQYFCIEKIGFMRSHN